MNNPSSRRHPVDSAGLDVLGASEAVFVMNHSIKKVSECGETYVGMRANTHRFGLIDLGRSHVVDKDKRTNHAAFDAGEGSANQEAAQIFRMRLYENSLWHHFELLFELIKVNIRRAGGMVKSEEFELVKTTMDVWSIKSLATQEIMHNPVGPWKEANDLYVEPSGLSSQLKATSEFQKKPFVLYDVGLGAAANSVAAISMFESLIQAENPVRPFHIYSFESNLKLLKFALDCAKYFPHIEAHQNHIRGILDRGEFSQGQLQWKLIEGDFNKKIGQAAELASLVFFDPYSPKTNPEMWGIETFEKVFQKLESPQNGGGLLLTYSQSTRVRSAMITAGFHVGLGPSTGLKEATTQASNKIDLLHCPLEKSWYQRWKSSHARYPMGCIDRHWCVDNAVRSYFLDQ